MNQALTWLDSLQFLNCVVMLLLANEANNEAMQDQNMTSSANNTAVDDGDGMYSEDTARQAAASRYLPAETAYVIMDPNHPESLMHVPIQS